MRLAPIMAAIGASDGCAPSSTSAPNAGARRGDGQADGFDVEDRHARVLADVVAEVPGLSGSIVHDTQTAVLMREHGIRRICTRDTDFHRFPFLEPIDPLVAAP